MSRSDDIVVYGKTIAEHTTIVRGVFKRLEDGEMRVNPKKLQIGQER